MEHLKTLRAFNLVFAVAATLFGLLFLALWGIGGILAIRDGEPMGWLFLLGGILACAILCGVAAAHVRVGRRIVESKGRIFQTALATLHLLSFPIGTGYSLYALWVCWMNDATKTSFDLHDKG